MGRSTKPDTKQLMLDAALRLFCEQGYDKTRVADIAGDVGVTSAAVYYHFESKDAILSSLVRPLTDAVDDLCIRHAPLGRTGEFCRRLLGEYLDIVTRWRPVVRLVLQDPAVLRHPEVGSRLQAQQASLQEMLAGGVNADATARAKAAATLGAVWRPVTVLDDRELASQHETLLEAACRTLGTGA